MTTNQNDPVNFMLIAYIILVFAAILMLGCNPVKQVIRDKDKLDKVAEVVVRSGYCSNDTVLITKSDTMINYDTVTNTKITTVQKNDTVYLWETKYRNVTKTVKIRDTVRQVVVDQAKINILEKDNVKLVDQLAKSEDESRKRLYWVFVLLLIILGYVYLKIKK
jgi:hypothetical protein